VYHSEAGSRAVELKVEKPAFKELVPESFYCYYNGGGVFVDAAKFANKGVEILASYSDPLDVDGGTAAIVYQKVGDGCALLTGIHPE
jgi:biotin--protein ligase